MDINLQLPAVILSRVEMWARTETLQDPDFGVPYCVAFSFHSVWQSSKAEELLYTEQPSLTLINVFNM